MAGILNYFPQKMIEICFYALFFLVPLVLTPFNYELFEYNKMMLVYGLTVIITGMWLIKIIIKGKIEIRRTPLDIPILLFLISQIISTVISLDPHVSIFGYYSRFNGGLLSTISYVLLYYAFVNNFPKSKILTLLKITIISAVLVASYGILEHFGIDRDLWVQDVQNRVFSTLGQPNWLAAYMAVLIPIALGFLLSKFSIFNSQFSINFPKFNFQNSNNIGLPASPARLDPAERAGRLGYWVIGLLFYTALIFTKSRSGFIGFWISLIVLCLLNFFWEFRRKFILQKTYQTHAAADNYSVNYRLTGLIILSFIIITFIFGAPFPQINRFTLPQLINRQQITDNKQQITKPIGSSVIDIGITESGTIRKIVWKGALDVIRHYPLFGSGVETFAFSYYRFRPAEHNMTSEWDFLYNKAHNEYLNYAATTGAFGLGSYLLIILVFIGWNLKKGITYQVLSIKYKNNEDKNIPNTYYVILNTALFTGWFSILVTNFFGFSVVIIQLFFFLIPAICFVLTQSDINTSDVMLNSIQHLNKIPKQVRDDKRIQSTVISINNYQSIIIVTVLSVICYLLFAICKLWYADTIFAAGYNESRSQDYAEAYKNLKKAIMLNEREPLYYDEFSFPAATLGLSLYEDKQATLAAQLISESILSSDMAITSSPNNVNFWKTRTRVFYVLSQIDDKYIAQTQESLKQAKILSPTDPKVGYNLALIYDKLGKTKEAIEELTSTTRLKPDYRDAYFALAFMYDKNKEKAKAKEALEFIVTRIATNDAEAIKKLNELK